MYMYAVCAVQLSYVRECRDLKFIANDDLLSLTYPYRISLSLGACRLKY